MNTDLKALLQKYLEMHGQMSHFCEVHSTTPISGIPRAVQESNKPNKRRKKLNIPKIGIEQEEEQVIITEEKIHVPFNVKRAIGIE